MNYTEGGKESCDDDSHGYLYTPPLLFLLSLLPSIFLFPSPFFFFFIIILVSCFFLTFADSSPRHFCTEIEVPLSLGYTQDIVTSSHLADSSISESPVRDPFLLRLYEFLHLIFSYFSFLFSFSSFFVSPNKASYRYRYRKTTIHSLSLNPLEIKLIVNLVKREYLPDSQPP